MSAAAATPREPRLHHVGVVQPSLARVAELIELLGLREASRGDVAAYQATCVFTEGNGATPFEFVVADGGPLARFNRGAGGLHHVALQVDSLRAVADELARRGMRLLEAEPVRGAGGFDCNFLSPAYTRGLIVEFVELRDGRDRPHREEPAAVVAGALRIATSAGGGR